MKRALAVLLLALVWCGPMGPIGCAGLLPALAGLAQGASFLSGALDTAEAGQQAWFARNPSQDAQAEVAAALQRARDAAAALAAIASAAKAADAGDVTTAKAQAVQAYAALRQLLDELGVLSGAPAAGGAETTAPAPVPVDLPTVDAVAAKLGVS